MLRRLLIGAVVMGLAAAAAAPARAYYSQVLMPGVTYSKQIQFTAHGPVVIHVVTAPKPVGLYRLRPILANGTVTGRQRVTQMEKSVSDQATVVGTNGDLFNWNDGHPSGMVMQDGILKVPPLRGRSSIGVTNTGTLLVQRVAQFGFWQGLGSRRTLSLNKTPVGDGTAVFTPSWGARTPVVAGAVETILEPYPPVVPGVALSGTAIAQANGGGTTIPRDGAVLMAIGSQASKLAAETPPGTVVQTQFSLTPNWPSLGVTDALGGGPLIVRNGRAVWTAGEDFLPAQLAPRNPRTGIGQRRDGTLVMVVVDGRRRGYSVGLTNWELAQTLVRLGCVTASALDSGGSSTLAFDGGLLNRPSDPGGERAVKETLALMYIGVYAPAPAPPVLSPNGDGQGERETLSYKIVRPSAVDAKLIDPTGATAYEDVGNRAPGIYQVTWPNSAIRHRSAARRRATGLALGRWRWVVSATDDQGQSSSVSRVFWVNDTLGFLKVSPRVARVGKHRRNHVVASFQVLHTARVTGSVWTRTGVLVRRIGPRRLTPGKRSLVWNGRYRSGGYAYRGRYVFKVYAQNAYGPMTLSQNFGVRN
jgi:phosphodiester glycosidase